MNLNEIMHHIVRRASEPQFQAGCFPRKTSWKTPKPAKPYHFAIEHVSDMSIRLGFAFQDIPPSPKLIAHCPALQILRPLPQIVGPRAYHSFAKLAPSVKNTAAHQEPASVSSYRSLGYPQKLCYLLPADQQIVFHHDLSSF